EDDAGAADGDAGRRRRRVRVPLLRRVRLHHRAADQPERRETHVSPSTAGDRARIPPLPKEQWGDDEVGAIRAGFGEQGVERMLSSDAPPIPNVVGTMVRHPRLSGPFLAYNSVLLGKPLISPRLRELMILRVAWRTRA